MTKIQLDQYFLSPHGNTRYSSAGNGPAVVLCHGTPTSSFIWHSVIEQLQDRYTLHFLDLPGYGTSDKFDGQDVRLRAFAQTVAAFVDHLKLERPHLVGHDFGAASVLGAHLVEGVKAKSIIIADGVVLPPWGTPFSRHVAEHESTFAAVPEYMHEAVIKAHLKTAVSRILCEDSLNALVAPWLGKQGQKAYYRQVGQYDYEYTTQLESLYPGIGAPLTTLWGEEDRWVDISEGRRFAELVPESTFIPLPDAGHFSMLDTPTAFANALSSALERVDR
jgi:pimeloyl-ACP methyl ester carboxylesterase